MWVGVGPCRPCQAHQCAVHWSPLGGIWLHHLDAFKSEQLPKWTNAIHFYNRKSQKISCGFKIWKSMFSHLGCTSILGHHPHDSHPVVGQHPSRRFARASKPCSGWGRGRRCWCSSLCPASEWCWLCWCGARASRRRKWQGSGWGSALDGTPHRTPLRSIAAKRFGVRGVVDLLLLEYPGWRSRDIHRKSLGNRTINKWRQGLMIMSSLIMEPVYMGVS